MKNLLTAVVFMLIATALMAQNTATTNQNGDRNGATIDQVGSNSAIIDQLNGSSDNTASIDQDGASNEAYLTQGMVDEYYDAPYNISTPMVSTNSDGSITQDGSSNYVEFVQVGDNNAGTLEQDGAGNTGYIYQGWPFGFWGETPVTSALSSSNSHASVSQLSNDNFGAIWQYGGDNNDANILQNGDGNATRISQGFIYEDANYNFSHPVYNVDDNYAAVVQLGNDNTARVFQLGNNNSFRLGQFNDGNTVGGRGLSGLEAARNGYFEQDGNNNIFNGVQNGDATLDHESFQFGDYNAIDLIQGLDDIALIQQTGDWNTANVHQFGGGHDASVMQNGDNNTSNITQQN